MAKQKIHFQHPQMSDGYHACGMGDRALIKITSNINEVTCNGCLRTAAGQKAQSEAKPSAN